MNASAIFDTSKHAHIIEDPNDELSPKEWKELGRPHCWVQTGIWESPTGSVRIELWKDNGYGANMIIHNDAAVISYLPTIFTKDKNWIVVINEDSHEVEFDVYWKWGAIQR